MNYLQKHWEILKNSFKLDDLTWKLPLIDIGFVLSLFVFYALILFLWVRTYLSFENLVAIAQSGQALAYTSGTSITQLWIKSIWMIILIFVLIVLAYVLLLSLYGALSHKFLSKKTFTSKLFINFLCVNAILTLLYIVFVVSIFTLSSNIKLIAWGMIIFTLLYIYALLIFYLVTKEDKLAKIFVHGFKSMIKLNHTLVPIVLSIILFAIVSIVIYLISFWSTILMTILAFLLLFYLITWVKKYLHHIVHE